jgi:hypothetical protein
MDLCIKIEINSYKKPMHKNKNINHDKRMCKKTTIKDKRINLSLIIIIYYKNIHGTIHW